MKKRTSFVIFSETFFISLLCITGILCVLMLTLGDTHESKPEQLQSKIEKRTAEAIQGTIMLVLTRNKNAPEYFVFISSTDSKTEVTAFTPETACEKKTLGEIFLLDGEQECVLAASKYLGISADCTCVMPFTTLANICDSLGGVTFTVPARMVQTDKNRDLYIKINPGRQKLDGTTLCDYISYSKSPVYPRERADRTSDIIALLIEQNKSNVDTEKLKEIFLIAVNNSACSFSYKDFYECSDGILYAIGISPVTARHPTD